VNGHHLALKMSGKLADRDADVGQLSLDLVAIGLAVVSAIKVEKAAVPGRDLNRLVSVIPRPFRDSCEGVMGRSVGCKLGQKQARALHRSHAFSPSGADAALEGELLCCRRYFGKKILFVNSSLPIMDASVALKFPEFDN
jgi:hypothetical protein